MFGCLVYIYQNGWAIKGQKMSNIGGTVIRIKDFSWYLINIRQWWMGIFLVLIITNNRGVKCRVIICDRKIEKGMNRIIIIGFLEKN